MAILVESSNSLSAGYGRALDLSIGGQQGATRDPLNWSQSATYVRQKLIPVLIEAPTFMKYMPNGTDRIRYLKALVEVMAESITGLQNKLDVEYDEQKVGNAGEMHHTMTRVSRVQTVPVFEWKEKEGMAIWRFFYQWIIDLIADPDTMLPRLSSEAAYIEAGMPEFTPESKSMTMLFIEPTQDNHRVQNAWMCTNMQPKTSGENEGKRIIAEANETVMQVIEFTSTAFVGDYVTLLAQSYMDGLLKDGFQPAALPAAYDRIHPDVLAGGEDYQNKVQAVSQSAAGLASLTAG